MTATEMYGEMREMIGSPEVNRVSNVKLDSYLNSALEWLASELNYLIREDEHLFTLVADQRKYTLPPDFLVGLWIAFDDNKLTGSSLDQWDRDGTDYRGSDSAVPSEYALTGRQLWLNPPASSTAIETAPALTARYVAAPASLEPGGAVGLSGLDQRLALLQAASLWCISHPSEENKNRYNGYQNWIERCLPAAKRRMDFPDDDYQPGWAPDVMRRGSAR